MPDSALGQLAQRVARIEQRVDDLASRAIERFGELSETVKAARLEATEDYKMFGPMLEERAEMRAEIRHLDAEIRKIETAFATAVAKIEANVVSALTDCRGGLADLERRWEEREREEKLREEERKLADRRDRWARWLGAVALTFTFVSMTVGWVILAL
jgi:DNA repair exonuclease SbcCD ATPase subunit